MTNWEDELMGSGAGTEEETPIYTQLYLEYREAMFRRIGFKLQQEITPGKDTKREAAIKQAQEEDSKSDWDIQDREELEQLGEG